MSEALDLEIRTLQSIFWSERDPDGLAFVPLADAFLKKGQVRDALDLLSEGTARLPDYATGHVVAARLYHSQGLTAEAELAARRTLELDPGNVVALSTLSEILETSGSADEAASLRSALVAIDPGSDEALAVSDTVDAAAETEPAVEDPYPSEAATVERLPAIGSEMADLAMEEPELEALLPETPTEFTDIGEVADAVEPEIDPVGGLEHEFAELEAMGDTEVVELGEPTADVVDFDALAPDEEPQFADLSELGPDEPVMDLGALAPDAEVTDVMELGALAPDDMTMDDAIDLGTLAPGESIVELGALAPDEAAVEDAMDLAALAPDEPVLDLGALAPDEPVMDLAALAPDEPTGDDAMDLAALAPDEPVMDLGALAPDEAEVDDAMDLAALAPDEPAVDDAMDLAALAPDEPVMDLGALAPDEAEVDDAMDLAALAPDESAMDDAMDFAALAPDEPVMDLGALAPDESAVDDAMDLAALAPDEPMVDDAMDLAALAPDEPVMDLGALAPEEPTMDLDALAPDEPVMDLGALAPDLPSVDAEHASPETESADMASDEPIPTRTLAELYVKQGFNDKALAVYESLLEVQPHADDLRDRIAELKGTGGAAETSTFDQADEVEALAEDLARSGEGADDVDTPFAWTAEESPQEADRGDIGRYFDSMLDWTKSD